MYFSGGSGHFTFTPTLADSLPVSLTQQGRTLGLAPVQEGITTIVPVDLCLPTQGLKPVEVMVSALKSIEAELPTKVMKMRWFTVRFSLELFL